MSRFLVPVVLAASLVTSCSGSRATPAAAPSAAFALASPTVARATEAPSSAPAQPSQAAAFPDAGAYEWAQVANGFDSPVDIQFAPDGSGRMFIVEQPGRIRLVSSAGTPDAAFLDLTDRVNTQGNERGLLGLAFHPRFSENGLFYVNYTDWQNHNVIARFKVSDNPDHADAGSESRLVAIDDPFPNHNGGVLAFGPDGYLYAGIGDGGSGGDPFGNGQNTGTLLGKILRFDVDGGVPYAMPAGNPFASTGGRPEVWAYGLRNPWRFSFDRLNGDLYVADVGQNTWEEIDYLAAGSAGGANFGWNYREGAHQFAGTPPPGLQLLDPVAEYSHNEGGCSVTGGYVYRGAIPEWNGIYLYGDFCSGKVWGLLHTQDAAGQLQWQSQLLFQTPANITSFGQDSAGEVYLIDRGGTIFQLQRKP